MDTLRSGNGASILGNGCVSCTSPERRSASVAAAPSENLGARPEGGKPNNLIPMASTPIGCLGAPFGLHVCLSLENPMSCRCSSQ